MVNVTIDNINIKVPQNSTIIEACDFAGIVVPRFCFHDKLIIAGNCRMCIVEIEKFPKPISSCTMNVNEGMKIFTKTPMVKRAQESVLEFLLINHPLDCPICDQGGECDLQDQLLFFGSDSSRYFKYKRGVEDKNCSLLVKTIMTRCIHCTRCVRFLTEVAGDTNLGVLGRSSQAEIGLYMDKNLESEFSGNVIDLCPVGALTSKPYSFRGRSWELTNSKSIDILDGLGSNIMVSTKGSEVMRILPNINEKINMEWISDKTRFSYDSFDYLRIKKPWCKSFSSFIEWSEAIDESSLRILSTIKRKKNIGCVLGDLTDLETALSFTYLCNTLGTSDVYLDGKSRNLGKLDFRSSYSFNTGISGIENADVCLLIGSDPRTEAALLNLRIRKQVTNGNLTLGYVGPFLDLTYEAHHLGLGSQAINSLICGTHPFCKQLKKAKNPCVIMGDFDYSPKVASGIKSILERNTNLIYENWNGLNHLSPSSGIVGLNELGLLSFNECFKKFKLLFLVGVDDISPFRSKNKDAFIIYIGSHYSVSNLDMSDLILPSSLFIEKDTKYINVEGLVQKTNRIRGSIGDSRPEWFYCLVVLDKLQLLGFKLNNKKSFYDFMEHEYPFIKVNKKLNNNYCVPYNQKSFISNGSIRRNIEDLYISNPITKASKVMRLCSENKKNKNFLVK
jgi:NADH-quinone oxidoreductase chain G